MSGVRSIFNCRCGWDAWDADALALEAELNSPQFALLLTRELKAGKSGNGEPLG